MARETGKRKLLNENAIAVIGEGITEQYYLQSIKHLAKVQITPKLPKHSTGDTFLEDEIKKCIAVGYSTIYCLIDMDNKKSGSEKTEYLKLKNTYHNKKFKDEEIGTESEIRFFENERCLEIWFLFYYKYTTAQFSSQPNLLKELNKSCKYDKTAKFFLSTGGLHQYFIKNKGSLENAKTHAVNSVKSRVEQNRDYTYSEMKDFFDLIEKK
jgi:hypothetical protein